MLCVRSPLLLQWVQCIDSRAGRPESQLIFPETSLAVVIEAMLNSSSWLKLVAVVPEILSLLGNTRCCNGPGQGTQLWWRGLKQRRLLEPCQGCEQVLSGWEWVLPRVPREELQKPTASCPHLQLLPSRWALPHQTVSTLKWDDSCAWTSR